MSDFTSILGPFRDVPDLDDRPETTAADLTAAAEAAGPAALSFRTSGSTGAPKVVPYSVYDLADLARTGATGFAIAGMTEDDASLNLGAPPPHISGWVFYASSHVLGATPLNANVSDWNRVIEEGRTEEATVVGSTPSVLRSVARRLRDESGPPADLFPNLRLAPTGGEPTTSRMRADLKELWGVDEVRDTYGTTEAGLVAAAPDESRRMVPFLDRFVLEVVPDEPTEGADRSEDSSAPVDVRDVSEPTTGALLITDPDREAAPLYRYRIGDVVTVYPDSDVPRIEALGREDHAVNLGGALLYEMDLESALDELYGFDMHTWKAVASRDEHDDPVVRVYAVGADLDAHPEAFRDRIFERNGPVKEAYGLGIVGGLELVTVSDVAAVERTEGFSFDDTRKAERVVFDESYFAG